MNGDLSLDVSDRLIYATFPRELKAAMQQAAQRNGWDRETGRYQTVRLSEALEASRHDPAVIAGWVQAYQPLPEMDR